MLSKLEWYTDKKGKRRGKVWLICSDCSKESITSIDNYYQYCKKHGKDTTYCKKCSAIRVGIKSRGKIPYNKGKSYPDRHREKAKNWNGGRYISKDGYYMILVESGPNNGNGWKKYRKEHQVIAEQILGRSLYKTEVVHHIDGNKLNNNIENLDIINNDKEHHRLTHTSLQQVGYELFKNGIIGYDRNTHKYYRKI